MSEAPDQIYIELHIGGREFTVRRSLSPGLSLLEIAARLRAEVDLLLLTISPHRTKGS